MKIRNRRIFELHADYCRAFTNPTRLMILDGLKDGEMSVGAIAEYVGVPMSTASQHLRALRTHHIVTSRKEGNTVYYRAVEKRLLDACQEIRTIILEGLKKRGELAHALDPAPSQEKK